MKTLLKLAFVFAAVASFTKLASADSKGTDMNDAAKDTSTDAKKNVKDVDATAVPKKQPKTTVNKPKTNNSAVKDKTSSAKNN